jgi:hypothetical protein
MIEQFSEILVIFGVIILFYFLLISFSPKKNGKDKIPFQHYYLVNSLHSKAELAFDKVLHKRLTPKYRVCPKVRLSDFARVRRKGVDSKVAYGLRRRCDPRHADWIVTKDDGTPVCWIELDDKSHNSKSAQIADKFKNDLADAIGIPLVRFRVGKTYHTALDRLPISVKH